MVVMAPVTFANEEGDDEADETDEIDHLEEPLPLELNSMLKSLPRGGSKRKEVKKRSWKASVQAYNDM